MENCFFKKIIFLKELSPYHGKFQVFTEKEKQVTHISPKQNAFDSDILLQGFLGILVQFPQL